MVAITSFARAVAPLATAAALALCAQSASAATTSLISAPDAGFPGGAPANTYTSEVDLSGDGRYAAFRTASPNLVPGTDANTAEQIYVRDTQTRATTLVSVTPLGTPASDSSFAPRISEDGRYVAFYSRAADLVAGDTNGVEDVFVRDLLTGTTTRASLGDTGAQLTGGSTGPALSANGRKVAFASSDPNAAPGAGTTGNVYLRDLDAGTTTRISATADGSAADDVSRQPSLSADGRYAAFMSRATNLVPGDARRRFGVYLRDVLAGTTTRISITSSGAQIAGVSSSPTISADGRRVGFTTSGPNVVAGDDDSYVDVFVRDLSSGRIIRATEPTAGRLNGASSNPVLNAAGDQVAFSSQASTLVAGDTNGRNDVFVRDLNSSAIERVSVSQSGAEVARDSVTPAGGGARLLSNDGRYVAFTSGSRDLVPGDASGADQAYLRDRHVEPAPRPEPERPTPEPRAPGGGTPPAATPPGPSGSSATAAAVKLLRSGTAWLRLRGGERGLRGLRAQRVAIAAGGAARRAGGLLTLPVLRGTLSATVADAQLGGELRLSVRHGRRTRTLRLLRPRLRIDGRVARLTAVHGGLRRQLFTIARTATKLERDRGRASATLATVSLTPAGARLIRGGLRLAKPLRAGSIGRLWLDARDTVAAPPSAPVPPAPRQTPPPAPPAPPAPEPEREAPIVAIGTTDWGFRASFRSYVFNGNGRPPIGVSGGASCVTDPPSTKGGCPADVGFTFAAVSGAYDPATGVGSVAHRGTVTFSYPGHFFTLALRDPTLTIAAGSVTVNARVTLDSTLAGTPSADARVDLGSFPLDGTPQAQGRRLTLRTGEGTLSASAAALLGGFLQEGAELDPLTLSADVVGGG